jgi:hypothetical protein
MDQSYTSHLEDYLLQYANRSALKMLVHLKTTYGLFNSTQLVDNYRKMTAPISFQDPIKTLFKQIEDGVRYANAELQQYMGAKYVNSVFLLILNTGAVPEACREWQHRTPVDQTWAEFRRELSRARREQCIISNTASGAGYHTANVAEHYVHGQLPDDRGFVISMANLVTDNSADRETLATLTNTIATLKDQLVAKDIWVKAQDAEIKRLLGGRAPAVAADAAYARKSASLHMRIHTLGPSRR